MEKSGIVYLMKTVIKGVYKIGISDENNFENRMRYLENNGYANVVGLERILAIKTDNYKEKEALLHEIFGKSQIGETELFAIDENLVKRLFLSLRGEIVFPKNETPETGFEKLSKHTVACGRPQPAPRKAAHSRCCPKSWARGSRGMRVWCQSLMFGS